METLDQNALDDLIADVGSSHRPWVLPLLRTIESAGGEVTPKQAKAGVRLLVEGQLTPEQIAYLEDKNRLGWTRFALRKRGFLEGEAGIWRLTDRARDYLECHREDAVVVPTDTPEGGDAVDTESSVPTETVPVTAQPAFEIPILQALDTGLREKQEVFSKVHDLIGENLLEGDHRVMKGGAVVWKYRSSWCLTRLRREGSVRNVGGGQWEITEAGKRRLEAEKDAWSTDNFGGARATVRLESQTDPLTDDDVDPTGPAWNLQRWSNVRPQLPDDVFDALDTRLRLQEGPSSPNSVSRNVILYGPPGTGKTFIAKKVARAITGQAEPDAEPLWRLVQFHPSYAYEDFVQGMRPDLERDDLRYKLAKGPFFEFCQTAADDPDRFYVLIVDEINRGDPARIFGELLYALEYRDEPVDLALGGQLTVPSNLIVIGTMNSVDRSVALVDYALRRRFGFIRISPNSELVENARKSEPLAATAARALDELNTWIADRLSIEHQIGHSFFLNLSSPLNSPAALDAIWQLDIAPLLEEYFFGDRDSLKEASEQWKRALSQASEDLQAEEAGDSDDVSVVGES